MVERAHGTPARQDAAVFEEADSRSRFQQRWPLQGAVNHKEARSVWAD
jgi:hypothetical protein